MHLFRHAPTLDLRVPALLWLSACSTAREMPRTTAAPATPPIVTLKAVDYAFETPDTIEAGITTFRLVNQGSQLHMAQLIRLEGGKSLDDFLEAYTEAFRTTGPRPPWAPRYGGPGAADPGGSSNATQHLEPGRYAWICIMNLPDGIPHVVKARMAKAFVVPAQGAATAPRTSPAATLRFQLVDYTFKITGPLAAGRQVIQVENAGTEPHEVALLRLAPGKTMEDFQAWMQHLQGPPPASSVGGVSSLAPRLEAYFEVGLTAGEYVVLCFVTAPDGRPHTEHGMIQHVRVN
jgi:hypothetical protein